MAEGNDKLRWTTKLIYSVGDVGNAVVNSAIRMVLGVPTYIVGAALTPVLVGLFVTKRPGYGWAGVIYGVLAAVALWVAARLRERKKVSESKAEMPPLQTLFATFKNRPFVQLIVAYMVASMAFALIKTLLAYFLTYQLGMEDQVPVVMLMIFFALALPLLIWYPITRASHAETRKRLEKTVSRPHRGKLKQAEGSK